MTAICIIEAGMKEHMTYVPALGMVGKDINRHRNIIDGLPSHTI